MVLRELGLDRRPHPGNAWPPPRRRSRPADPRRGIYRAPIRLISGAHITSSHQIKRAQPWLRPKSIRPSTGGLGMWWIWPDTEGTRYLDNRSTVRRLRSRTASRAGAHGRSSYALRYVCFLILWTQDCDGRLRAACIWLFSFQMGVRWAAAAVHQRKAVPIALASWGATQAIGTIAPGMGVPRAVYLSGTLRRTM